jgi:hypothetical protein
MESKMNLLESKMLSVQNKLNRVLPLHHSPTASSEAMVDEQLVKLQEEIRLLKQRIVG